MTDERKILLERDDLGRAISRMAREIVERSTNASEVVLIGIRSRGVHIAERIHRSLKGIEASADGVPFGVVDITLYRDDLDRGDQMPLVQATHIDFALEGRHILLVDDVIFRGRTIRAAMDAVERLGQPKHILVAVLIDRGARELPIRADIVGKNIEAGDGQRVNVLLEESDGVDQVTIANWQGRSAK